MDCDFVKKMRSFDVRYVCHMMRFMTLMSSYDRNTAAEEAQGMSVVMCALQGID